MIPVTKPFLPPIGEYEKYLEGIWERNWLTNNGPLVTELEQKLKDYLKVNELLYVTNGTIAIQLAIKALGLRGEIITTPFSYVATTSSVVWEGCKPVFVDIDSKTFNLDPQKIEDAITSSTSAILATHVFGNPCAVHEIENIAKRKNLKVIYDGAHAFDVELNSKSVFNFGDVSTLSLHSTKLFHSVEGGAVVSKDQDLMRLIDFHRNFGHNGPGEFASLGINGKNSEFHAAMGLVNLKYVKAIIPERKSISETYDHLLQGVQAIKPFISKDVQFNFAYYPLVFRDEELLLKVIAKLNQADIFPRRYFYPTLEKLPYVERKNNCPVASSISERVLCLPLFNGMTVTEIEQVAELIMDVSNSNQV